MSGKTGLPESGKNFRRVLPRVSMIMSIFQAVQAYTSKQSTCQDASNTLSVFLPGTVITKIPGHEKDRPGPRRDISLLPAGGQAGIRTRIDMHSGGTRFMKALDGLDPQALWRHFGRVSRIQGIGNEAAIAGHVRTLASASAGVHDRRCGQRHREEARTRGMPLPALHLTWTWYVKRTRARPTTSASTPSAWYGMETGYGPRAPRWVRTTASGCRHVAIMEDTSPRSP
jgi:hypothetical protein